MRKTGRILVLSSALLLLAAGYNNFSYPTAIKESGRDFAGALTGVRPAEPLSKRYVKIEGQLVEYNPKGVYNVKGVPTYYVAKSLAPKPLPKKKAKKDDTVVDPSVLDDKVGSDNLDQFGPDAED
jgi:hypothetical protein